MKITYHSSNFVAFALLAKGDLFLEENIVVSPPVFMKLDNEKEENNCVNMKTGTLFCVPLKKHVLPVNGELIITPQ